MYKVLVVLVVFALVIGIGALFGLALQYVLAQFGVHLSFWVCWLIWILVTALFRMAGSSKS